MASLGERLRAAARPQRAGASRAASTRRIGSPPASAVVVPRQQIVDEPAWEPAEAAFAAPDSAGRTASELRRERRELARRYEALQRDIGGLAIEMARQANFNYPLLRARSEEALRIEQRVAAIDAWFAATSARRTLARLGRHGRVGPPALPPAPPAPADTCPRCGGDLPANANFCAFCGATVVG